MHIIFAGNTGVEKRELILVEQDCSRLFSFYFVHTNFYNSKTMFDIASNKVDLFLDSGAFSAKTQGITIDIQDYISFIKEHEAVLNVYANLDVIGDPIGTRKNQRIMERAGLSPLPVFHFGEDPEKYLKPLINKYEYICIGGMVKSGELVTFLDNIFSKYICDENGFPKVKIHGFGLTSLRLMLRYPWFSCDSTSWVLAGRMGGVYIPKFRNGKYVYDIDPWKIAVSNQSPNTKEAGQHITTLSPNQKKVLFAYIHEKGYVLGSSHFKKVKQIHELKENEKWAEKKPKSKTDLRLLEIIDEPGISNKYQLRDEMNIMYYLDLEKSIPAYPRQFKMKGVQNGFF